MNVPPRTGAGWTDESPSVAPDATTARPPPGFVPALRRRAPPRRAPASAALASLAAFGAAGCDTGQLPPGATLSIAPDTRRFVIVERLDADGRCVHDPDHHVDEPLVISLRDAQGAPIGDAEVRVHVTFAENTYSGRAALALYDDANGNGVVDAESELVSGADDALARVRTSRYGGERVLLLRVNLSCGYRASVLAYAEGTVGLASVEVVDESPEEPAADSTDGGAEEGDSDR